jgi:hypothetical protein
MSYAVPLALAACTASPPGGVADSGYAPWSDATPAVVADAAPPGPDAQTVDCPPGLPDSFDASGNAITNKNGPPTFDTYNVFADLDSNPRWFFAMNLHESGVFAGGVVPGKYDISGEDTDVQYCDLCVNMFADYDQADGGNPQSLHMFAQKGTLIIDSVSGDEVSGHLQDVLLGAIVVVYDDESEPCGDIDDDSCGNTICLNNDCGRQVGLVGCSTSIQRLDF